MKKKYAFIAAAAVLLVILAIGPIKSYLEDPFPIIFDTTPYFSDPEKAFWNNYSPGAAEITFGDAIESVETIEAFKINDYTAPYFAITDTGDLLIVEMKCKGDKFKSAGNQAIVIKTKKYTGSDYGEREEYMMNYDKSSEYRYIYWTIVYDENIIDKEKYQVHELKANDFDEKVFFVYRFGN